MKVKQDFIRNTCVIKFAIMGAFFFVRFFLYLKLSIA